VPDDAVGVDARVVPELRVVPVAVDQALFVDSIRGAEQAQRGQAEPVAARDLPADERPDPYSAAVRTRFHGRTRSSGGVEPDSASPKKGATRRIATAGLRTIRMSGGFSGP
jgi:hypothetical protein